MPVTRATTSAIHSQADVEIYMQPRLRDFLFYIYEYNQDLASIIAENIIHHRDPISPLINYLAEKRGLTNERGPVYYNSYVKYLRASVLKEIENPNFEGLPKAKIYSFLYGTQDFNESETETLTDIIYDNQSITDTIVFLEETFGYSSEDAINFLRNNLIGLFKINYSLVKFFLDNGKTHNDSITRAIRMIDKERNFMNINSNIIREEISRANIITDNIPEDKPVKFKPFIMAVYGTLKQGHRNNGCLGDAPFMEVDYIKYDKMVNLGFPAIKFGTGDGDKKIEVELFEINKQEIADRVDRLEGVPSLYQRKNVKTESDKTVVVYEIQRDIEDESIQYAIQGREGYFRWDS